MASATLAKRCLRLTSQLMHDKTVLTPFVERLLTPWPRRISSQQFKANCERTLGATRSFSLSAIARNESPTAPIVEDMSITMEDHSISMEDHSISMEDHSISMEAVREDRVNFDAFSGEKQLCYDDGVPDVLYRRIEVKCLAHESPLLDSYQRFVEMTSNGFRLPVEIEEPCRIVERKTTLRSAFVHKDIRVQYEWYTFYRLFRFTHLTGSTADTLLEYLQRNLPEGMAMEVTKTRVERLPLGVEASKGETPSKEAVFGGRKRYGIDTIQPYPKPDPEKMPDDWNPRSCDERFEPIPV